MMEDKEIKQKSIKKQLILTVLGVLVLVIAVAGASFAAWNYVFNGTLVNTISTNDISLDLLESDDEIINITNALPMSDNEGKVQTETFDFAVTSKTVKDIDIEYNINIEKLTVDNGYTSLNDNQIKVYLTDYNNTQKVAPTLVSNLTNYKLYTGKHSHDSTHETVQDKFKLRAWIDGSVDASNWNASTKLQYKFKIGLTSTEKEKSVYPEYVYRYGTNIVGLGNSIESVTGTKWIIKLNGEENEMLASYVYDTHADCTAFLTQNGITEGQDMSGSTYTCAEKEGTFGGFDYTEDYTTLNKTYFLGHKIGNDGKVERNDACFIRNNTLYCLKGVETANAGYSTENPAPYYGENYNTLLEAFGPNAIENNVCSVDESPIYCSVSGLYANADMDGDVGAIDGSTDCYADYGGYSVCHE